MTLAIPLSLGEGRAVCREGQGVVVKTGRTRLRNLESGIPSPVMKHIPEGFCAGLWPAHSRKHCLVMNQLLKMQRELGVIFYLQLHNLRTSLQDWARPL